MDELIASLSLLQKEIELRMKYRGSITQFETVLREKIKRLIKQFDLV